jgi:hypothetical protein
LAARKTKRKKRPQRQPWIPEIDWSLVQRAGRAGTWFVMPLVLLACGGWGLTKLEQHVERELVDSADARLVFTNLPDTLGDQIRTDLEFAIADLSLNNWMGKDVCESLARRIGEVAWVASVRHVRRVQGGRIEITCNYRTPFAMTRDGTHFYLVGADGVRLPGVYGYDAAWPHVIGSRGPAPEPGGTWPTGDLKAGLDLVSLLARESFRHQVTAVLVENYRGRVDSRLSHLELATDRNGGRVLWGSEIGREIEENSASEKLAILRTNFHQTGRLDANHPAIDVTTHPDRYAVPK